MPYFLLVGIHGVGKTTLTNKLKSFINITSLSVSDLIREAGNDIKSGEKFTQNIENNQNLWKLKLSEYIFSNDEIVLLDGHFTLLNANAEIVELPFSTFNDIEIKKIILKTENPEIIKNRLEIRDNKSWDERLIYDFQEAEIKRAKEFSKLKNIPIFEIQSDQEIKELIRFIQLRF